MDSILDSIKHLLGIDEDETHFDTDITIHINSVFSILHQMGVGPDNVFSIENKDQTWDDFILDEGRLNDVKTYIYLKVRMIFDPPANSNVMNAMERQITELEFRLSVAASNIAIKENNYA